MSEASDKHTAETLRDEMHELRTELAKLNRHRFVRTYNSMPKLMALSFARGLMVGLGTVIGATVLLSVLVWVLSQVEVIPIIGQWAAQIADIVEQEID